MAKLGTDEKRIFVVASASAQNIALLTRLIHRHIYNSLIYVANDGFEAIFKMENSPPHVLIADSNLPKITGNELVQKVLSHSKISDTSMILLSEIPDRENFVDQVVTCQIQFLADIQNEALVTGCLTRALNRLSDEKNFSYRLKFLTSSEILFREGEQAESVFIVKRGDLQAYKGDSEQAKILGKISVGEFVGEMAHINGEPRSATVRALTDCELIEIPTGTLDTVLFSKPAWSRALVATLSRRLKRTNESL